MFGVVPKTIWQKTNPADAKQSNRHEHAMSAYRRWQSINLIDTGLGTSNLKSFLDIIIVW